MVDIGFDNNLLQIAQQFKYVNKGGGGSKFEYMIVIASEHIVIIRHIWYIVLYGSL